MPDLSYDAFLARKAQDDRYSGFAPVWMPDFLFDFQRTLVDWAVRKGKSALLEDCGLGKGQPEGALILTDIGFVANTKLKIGDKVVASDGNCYPVKAIHIRGMQPTYRLCFSDGTRFIVDSSHLHIVRTNNDRVRGKDWRIMSTDDLRSTKLRYGSNGKSRNYDIPVVSPIKFPKTDHLIHPYVLGVLLGDGCITNRCSITVADEQICETVKSFLPEGWTLTKKKSNKYEWIISKNGLPVNRAAAIIIRELERLQLRGTRSTTKFIPQEYLFDSVENRLWLLRGLMDTDGYIKDTTQFYSTSNRLASDFLFLVQSLGGCPTRSLKQTSCMHKGMRRTGAPCHILTFSLKTFNPFHLARKAVRWNPNPRDNGRWIDKIEDCGMRKTICISATSPDESYVTEHCIVTHNSPQELVWAENVVRKTNKPVLMLAPLAVSQQMVREADKFGIDCRRSMDGTVHPNITVTNYERLHYFDPERFAGVVCDESSVLKSFTGQRKKDITRFMSKLPYRLLGTATAAPNDFIELGTSSEALGQMGYMDVLSTFFINDENSLHPNSREYGKAKYVHGCWRLKGHSEQDFWRWVCSWARAVRHPSDAGGDDERFTLPPLNVIETAIENEQPLPGELFVTKARTLQEQRAELRATLKQRCEKVAELVSAHDTSVIWCDLNDEGDMLERIIPDAVQVAGKNSDDEKEGRLDAFSRGEIPRLITKAKIGGFGLNWQHCAHMTFFPSHSFERYYQSVRRCWRFGQTRPVTVDVITTQGEAGVLANLQRKSAQADGMFARMVAEMNNEIKLSRSNGVATAPHTLPQWIQQHN